MIESKLWLVGAGSMSQEYAKVLSALNLSFEVIGRGNVSADAFELKVKHNVIRGGLELALRENEAPKIAIVAVAVEHLADIISKLILAGTKRILLEKPGALNYDELYNLNKLAIKNKADVLIAYNRRFYHSVQQARDRIAEDGGLLSMSFDFTEWSHKIAPLQKGAGVKQKWVIGNSSHVIDLAFHFGGTPVDWNCWHSGSLDWHTSAARFCGAGITDKNVMFSYLSDWEAPGRWGLELMTSKRRFILRPMEILQITQTGSVLIQPVERENNIDEEFKPGLYKQVSAFLKSDDKLFCKLNQQSENMKIYSEIAGY